MQGSSLVIIAGNGIKRSWALLSPRVSRMLVVIQGRILLPTGGKYISPSEG
jgi:hypothetical protein